MSWRISARLRWLRRGLSRSEWAVRLLGLSRSTEGPSEPGLILIQIDGLSRTQVDRALERGRLPFLKGLIEKQGYDLHTMYSGLPSTTPSVQGELFYGVRPAVPAFSFFSHEHGRIIKMFDPDVVPDIQAHLDSRGQGLFEGGSVYSDIYSGGAEEAHFCSATFGWSKAIKAANPFKFALVIALNFVSFVRSLVLVPIELVLSFVDFFQGTFEGQNIGKELKFIPTRVLICILLREFITIGTMMDAARGLPIIHLNYLGYDEQAHRRGPESEFAHWTLKGIDFAIRRIYESAKRSDRRLYDVWVYSDHGQERVVPYPVEHGRTLQAAVEDIFSKVSKPASTEANGGEGIESQRARYLSGWMPERFLPPRGADFRMRDGTDYTLAAMGPIGHINFGAHFDRALMPELADRLVKEAGVPAVLLPDGSGHVRAWTPGGIRMLPEEFDAVIGEDHPFKKELTKELLELCLHPDAGEMILLGWRPGGRPMSFPIENGAHAGPGPEETRAFALLPSDAPLEWAPDAGHMRTFDLREAALRHLGRLEAASPKQPLPILEAIPETIRVMTFDANGCLGTDGKVSVKRIARVIARYRPDIVCLQHLEGIGHDGRDQAAAIASAVRMEMHILSSLRIEDARWGDAILSRYPLEPVRSKSLSVQGRGDGTWAAGFQEVSVRLGKHEIRLINAQLSPRRRERDLQIQELMETDRSNRNATDVRMIVCANGERPVPAHSGIALGERLVPAQVGGADAGAAKRKRRSGPRKRGSIYCSRELKVLHVECPTGDLIRMASPEAPLIVEFRNPWAPAAGSVRG